MRKTFDHVNHVAAPVTAGGDGRVPAAEEVLEAIHGVMHLFRAGLVKRGREGGQASAHMEGRALGFIARHPGATLKDLVQHSGRDKGQLARLLASLKERGLLAAQADEADRRQVRLQLTSEGRRLQQVLQRQRHALAEAAVADLSPAERQQLMALLGKLRTRLGTDEPC